MAGSIVGKVLACIVLVVLCFIIGAQAAESAASSMVIIAAVVGVVFMLIMGPRSWMLLFLLPPIIQVLPLPYSLARFNNHYLVAIVVLGYWIVMWGMGYVKMRWRSMWVLDALAFFIFSLVVASYIKKPISINVLGMDTDNIGGRPYVLAIGAFIYYLTISFIPVKNEQLGKVLNWSIWVTLVSVFLVTLKGLAGYGAAGYDGMAEDMQGSRFGAFLMLGEYAVVLLYALFPLVRFIINPALLLGMAASFGMILISGFRSFFAIKVVALVFMSIVKKEFCLMVGLAGLCYAGLILMSAGGGLSVLPYGVQRVAGAIPGVIVDSEAQRDGDASSDWRYEMWGWALDPRTRFIKDYVWGDGIGLSKKENDRDMRAIMRREILFGDQNQFASSKQWHSMIVTTIQSWGYVGLVAVFLIVNCTGLLIIRICMSLRGTSIYVPALIMLMPFTSNLVFFYLDAGTLEKFFNFFVSIAQAKFFYCVAREEGLLIPWGQRKRYIPKMIQDYEDKLRPAQQQ